MLITCLMPTFNRLPDKRNLIVDAVRCFNQQDYPQRRLLIGNDTPGQRLEIDLPGVRVINFESRFPTLSDKIRAMIAAADPQTDAFCRWDDDDLSLPHRLSYSAAKLGDSLEWRAENYWWEHAGGRQEEGRHKRVGNTHCMSLWRREVLDRIGGYPRGFSGNEDQEFNRRLRKHGISDHGEVIPTEDLYYVYRWGVSNHHLSGRVDEPGGGCQQHYDQIGRENITPGAFDFDEAEFGIDFYWDAIAQKWRIPE